MGNMPADFNGRQFVRDLLFSPNRCRIDDRFVIRDGKRHPFAVICPGGAYWMVCSYIEGVPVARKLNEMGISAFIVYYRVRGKARYPAPQDDLAAAIRKIISKKDAYHLECKTYSLWGSSAGGHLVASFGTQEIGYAHYGLPRPAAIVLSYPVISMRKELTHQGSHDNLLGEGASAEEEAFTSIDEHVTEAYPPVYLWCGDADQTVSPDNTRHMCAALERAGVPVQCEIFKGVDHGVGPGTGTAAEGWIEKAVAFWQNHQSGIRRR